MHNPLTNEGLGRIGTTAFFLGTVGGIHVGFVILITLVYYSSREEMSSICVSLYQWSLYMALLCLFHFSEFFTTAIYQPTSLSYDSFIINHRYDIKLCKLFINALLARV